MLELLEWRHDWMSFPMTVELMRYVLTKLIPDVIFHSAGQDEEHRPLRPRRRLPRVVRPAISFLLGPPRSSQPD